MASRFLGGFLGKEDAVRHLLEEKVRKWVEAVEDLAEAAEVYPQDAYVCFIKSLQCEWKGLLRRWTLWIRPYRTSSCRQSSGARC